MWLLWEVLPTNVNTSVLLLIFTLYLIYRYSTRNHNYWRDRGVPYEEPVFLAGNLWDVFKGKRQIGKHLGHLYGRYSSDTPYFGIYIMGQPYLVLRSPEIIKSVTIRDFNNFDDRTFACDVNADPMAGNSLFIMKNPDWKSIRNKLTPIFTSGKLKLMMNIMKKCSEEMQIHLDNFDGQVVEVKEVAAKYMTDLVASCFFGFETNSFKNEECRFRKASKEMFDLSISRSFSMFSYFFVPQFVFWFKLKLLDTTFLKNVFLSTLELRERTKTRRNDFVDLLLQLRDNLIESEDKGAIFDTDRMVSQAITFFIAGFETTSNALAFALYELCLRTDCQERLRQEIFEKLETDDDVTFENIQKLEYLDMVFSETLRRYPFGPFLNRQCKEEYVIKETGLVVEKGTPILIPLDGLHFDPHYYPEPEKFDPERFADGKKQQYHQSCTYMPFGMGPRNCIGDRFGMICAKVGLVYFLKKFKVEKCEETPSPLVLDPKSPFMLPIDGLKMLVTKL
ncbi:hypothetical protein JTB14_032274 [Gonioctena quinquepunctata]|nr:hypothetical protein JTB14_032274 [Gonioctena quinquepunctata]